MTNEESLCEVEVKRNALIKMRDGINLAADVYRPSAEKRFPAIVAFIPYHKDAMFGTYPTMNYFAQRGYAGLVVDVRGTGSSEGCTQRPMSKGEQLDGYDVVEWVGKQGWCDGNVGVWGISYSGFMSLQVAALAPPHLKAIASIDADLDMYSSFAYPGGCLNALSLCGGWGPFMFVMNSMPPLYLDNQNRWRKVWAEHLKGNEPWLLYWLAHRLRDDYWKETSTLEQIEEIEVPVLAIGGWRDLYPSCVLQLLTRLKSPRKIIVGPWAHGYPDMAIPPPQIDYVAVLHRWWDFWLKGEKNGIMDETAGTFYVQGLQKWIGLQLLPTRQQGTLLYLSGRKLTTEPLREQSSLTHSIDNTVGLEAGLWSFCDLDVGLPLDQLYDQAHSLTFDSSPQRVGLQILGSPRLSLSCSFSGTRSQIVAKLMDVSADGRSTLITSGWQNANHNTKHEEHRPLQIGQIYDISLDLYATCYYLPPQHALRLAISGSDFPRIWPCPQNVDITIHEGGDRSSSLFVPIVDDTESPAPLTPVCGPGFQDPRTLWKITHDPANSTKSVDVEILRRVGLGPGVTWHLDHRYRAGTTSDAPSLTAVTSFVESRYESIDKRIIVQGKSLVGVDAVDLSLYVEFNGVPYHSKTWHVDGIPNLT